jgi:hypothetical protein
LGAYLLPILVYDDVCNKGPLGKQKQNQEQRILMIVKV